MTAPIVTPLLVRDAEALATAAFDGGTPFRAAVVERVTALVMRVDVASRERAEAELRSVNGHWPELRELRDVRHTLAREIDRLKALLVTCHRALLTVNEWLLSAYTDDKPIHPGAHRLLAETVQAVLDRFKAEGR